MSKASAITTEAATKAAYAEAYARLRRELKAAAKDCIARNHMAYDGFCGWGYCEGVDNAFDQINEDWPKDRAWYEENGRVYRSWIDRRDGRNKIQQSIDYWNKY